MGFMDKAKKMAEQAQAKLDEAQKQFNSGQQSGQPPGQAVDYDEHGRPISQTAPESAAPPHGDPLAGQRPPAAAPEPVAPTPGVPPTGQGDPVAPPPPSDTPPIPQPGVPPTATAPPAPQAPAPQTPPADPSGGAPAEDRNHPSYAPPKLSSGDPLAG